MDYFPVVVVDSEACRVGTDGRQRASLLVLEAAVYGLHVGEDALPVRLAHRHHVVYVQ